METIPAPEFAPLAFKRLDPIAQIESVRSFYETMNGRRSVRDYASEEVPFELIERAITTAGTAPSGANMQPWHFVVVNDAHVKSKIRAAAEAEERLNYEGRMPERWLRRLAPLGTGWQKPFLEIAPYLIVVFRIDYLIDEVTGETEPTYYAQESVGIAVGLLLGSLQLAGLATLTHTPSPMRFLNEILKRPKNEKPFVLIPVGYPAKDARVPEIERKQIHEIIQMV